MRDVWHFAQVRFALVFSLATFNLGRSPSERRGSLQVQSEDGRGVDKPFFMQRERWVCVVGLGKNLMAS